jgi:predicted secreted hydrolase
MAVQRRAFIAAGLGALALRGGHAAGPVMYPTVMPGTALDFPRDHGAHPDHRVEWWYLSGWLEDAGRRPLGFHLSFFRLRPGVAEESRSRFAPRQLLFAHAALANPDWGALRYAQRAGRAGVGAAEYSESDTAVRIRDWSLVRRPGGEYLAAIEASAFRMKLTFTPTQALLLQGEQGYSRKGPEPQQASFYYSLPQLAVRGELEVDGEASAVNGGAWLDHEWSSELLAPGAAGWDWTAVNLTDGGALMAFRIRDRSGHALWAGGTWREATGATRVFAPEEVAFTPIRRWRSPRTGGEYPVEIKVALGDRSLRLAPLLDDQELDTRRSVGAVYWDGAVSAYDARLSGGAPLGRGYLEFTGYAGQISL